MGKIYASSGADYLFCSSAILQSIEAGCSTIAELENATALPATTIIRVAAQLVEDEIINAEWVSSDVVLTMAIRPDP